MPRLTFRAHLKEATVSSENLSKIYRDYIACLNEQAWPELEQFVHEDLHYNNQPIGLSGYKALLENDYVQIPDLHFNVQLLVADSGTVAARLNFDCSPKGTFLELPINGKKVQFSENVFYEFLDGKIRNVWSVLDKVAIEAQL